MRSCYLYLVSLQRTLKSVCPLCCKWHAFLFSKLPCVTAFWPSNCHLGTSNCLPPLYKRSSQLGVDYVYPHIEGQQGVRRLPENPATPSHLAPLCVAWGRQWSTERPRKTRAGALAMQLGSSCLFGKFFQVRAVGKGVPIPPVSSLPP